MAKREMTGEKFQGNPCKRGHSGMRYSKGGACVECVAVNRPPNGRPRGPKPKEQPATKRPPGRPKGSGGKAAPKPITVTQKRLPANHRYLAMTKPAPPPPLEGAETVEQFLARGGVVEQVTIGATGYKGN